MSAREMHATVSVITGNEAAATAAKLARVQVIAAYPITPQSPVVEQLSAWVESGELPAEFVTVESEHSALTVCITASTVGARVFTATSANGLAYMTEQVWWAAGARLPIVMCVANRAMAAPWNVLNDQQDSMSVRDAGWIQLYCRDNQEILDTTLQAYRIAEQLHVPVMVCYDGFLLSHTVMPVELIDAETADAFLPPYTTPLTIVDPDDPRNIGPVTIADPRADADGVVRPGYMEIRQQLHAALSRGARRHPRGRRRARRAHRARLGRPDLGVPARRRRGGAGGGRVARHAAHGRGRGAARGGREGRGPRHPGVPAVPGGGAARASSTGRKQSRSCSTRRSRYGFEGPICTDLRAALLRRRRARRSSGERSAVSAAVTCRPTQLADAALRALADGARRRARTGRPTGSTSS